MKVKQIVGEHKKGVRAKIYARKPKAGPEPRKPVKPVGPEEVKETATITKSGPEGVEITADDGVKTTLPPEKATALAPDPQTPGEYDLNPNAINPNKEQSAETGPKVGSKVDMKTTEDGENDLGTIPVNDFVKALYDTAAKLGAEAPNPEEIKKIMVLTPTGEVDNRKTFEKIMAEWQGFMPQLDKLLKDLRQMLAVAQQNRPGPTKAAAAGNAPYNPLNRPEAKLGTGTFDNGDDLTRIQELAGMTDEDVSFNGLTQHDNGDMSYSAGPMSVRQSKDGSLDAQYDSGMGTFRMQRNPVGVKTLSATGDVEDQVIGTDASAKRLGVDPRKVKAQIGTNESKELEAMLRIAGLR